jgi:hypothetical protein
VSKTGTATVGERIHKKIHCVGLHYSIDDKATQLRNICCTLSVKNLILFPPLPSVLEHRQEGEERDPFSFAKKNTSIVEISGS